VETWAIVLAGAILLGAAMIAAVVGLFTARLGDVLARLETRADPDLFIEQVDFVPYVRVSYGELQSTAWGHIPLTFPSTTPGLWDVLTSRQDQEIRMRGRFAVKNAGGSALPPRAKYRCFFGGEPCGEGTHQSANPLAAGESVSFQLDVALPLTTPAIGVGDLVVALRIETPGARGPFLFWYDSSTNEWRQDIAGLDPELLARVVV
jgi:hypothetical protein